MKLVLAIVVVSLLVFAGFAVASLGDSGEDVSEESPSCNRECGAGNTCSNPDCGVSVEKSCGCGRWLVA